MKKTVQVNLSGQVFTLDEDAYDLLSNYLNRIGRLYERSPGKDEILSDIEVRIVELLMERLTDTRQVVSLRDVEAVIGIMGRPEQFEQDEFDEDEETSGHTAGTDFRSKRLYRDPENPMIGGVCSGIAYYFGVDPLWFRLAFGISLIFFGTGILLYILLWIVIPEAKTASEKLSMKGEPVNISSIGKTIEDEINTLGERLSRGEGAFRRKHGKKLARGIDRFFYFITELIKGIFNVIGKFLGSLFLIIGVICVIALLAGMIGIADFIHFDSVSMNIYEWGDMMFESGWVAVAIVAFLLVAGIPFIALAYGGFLLLMPRHKVPYLGAGLFGLWFLGVIMAVLVVFSTLQGYSKTETIVDQVSLADQGIHSDTIILQIGEDPFNIPLDKAYRDRDDFMMKIDGSRVMIGNVSFDIQSSPSGEVTLEVVRSAGAGTFDMAREKTEAIQYDFEADSSNHIVLNAYFTFPIEHLLRSQEVKVILRLPEGKTVYLSEGMKRIAYDIDNVTHTHDPYMVKHYWRMEKHGLTCLDCEREPVSDDGDPSPLPSSATNTVQ